MKAKLVKDVDKFLKEVHNQETLEELDSLCGTGLKAVMIWKGYKVEYEVLGKMPSPAYTKHRRMLR